VRSLLWRRLCMLWLVRWLRLLCLHLSCGVAFQCINWRGVAKVARGVAWGYMSRRRVVAVSVLAVLACDIAEVAHVSTGQVLAVEWLLGHLNGGQVELVEWGTF
jgi:hypothetical protein